jgi:hypothetical protein
VALRAAAGARGDLRRRQLEAADGPLNDPPTKPKKIAARRFNATPTGSSTACAASRSACAPTAPSIRCLHAERRELDRGRSRPRQRRPEFDVDFQALHLRINGAIETPTTTRTLHGTCNYPRVVQAPGDFCKGAKKQIKIVTLDRRWARSSHTQ